MQRRILDLLVAIAGRDERASMLPDAFTPPSPSQDHAHHADAAHYSGAHVRDAAQRDASAAATALGTDPAASGTEDLHRSNSSAGATGSSSSVHRPEAAGGRTDGANEGAEQWLDRSQSHAVDSEEYGSLAPDSVANDEDTEDQLHTTPLLLLQVLPRPFCCHSLVFSFSCFNCWHPCSAVRGSKRIGFKVSLASAQCACAHY